MQYINNTSKIYQEYHYIVPEGISSSMRVFIVLLFNFEVFHIKFSEKKSPQKNILKKNQE